MNHKVAGFIAETPIPRVAWKRAGLDLSLLPSRPTLAACTIEELRALSLTQTETPEGLAFTRYAAMLASVLQNLSVTAEDALAGTDPVFMAMTEDAWERWREERVALGWINMSTTEEPEQETREAA